MYKPVSEMTREELQEEVDKLAPWHYCHVLPFGVTTGDCTAEEVHPKLKVLLDAGAFKRRRYPFILDLGANSGLISMWFATNKGSNVMAVEGGAKFFEQLTFVVQAKGYQSTIMALPFDIRKAPHFGTGVHDLVLLLGVLHHIEESYHVEILQKCLRALWPGGEIVVQTKDDLPVAEMLLEAGFVGVEKLNTNWHDRAAWQAIKDPMKL